MPLQLSWNQQHRPSLLGTGPSGVAPRMLVPVPGDIARPG
jgi:hypothetical protein